MDIGLEHLVGFKYVGWGLLHRPKDGNLVQLRTLFVQLHQIAILGLPPAPPIEVSDANQSFQGRVHALNVGSKHLVGFRYACGWLLHRRENSLLALLWHDSTTDAPESKGHFEAAATAAYQPP